MCQGACGLGWTGLGWAISRPFHSLKGKGATPHRDGEGEILARSSEGRDEHHVYYCIEVPGGAASLTVDLTDAEGFFDIQVVPPGHGGMFHHQVERSQPDKSLTIDDVPAGAY